MSDWKFSSTATDWIFGSTNFVAPAGDFSIISAPETMRRGIQYVIECLNVTEAPTDATLGGQALTVDDYTSTSVTVTPSTNINLKHGTDKTLSITVDGVSDTALVNFIPEETRDFVDLVDPANDLGTVFYDMTNAGVSVDPATGHQFLWTTVSDPSGYLIDCDAQGYLIIDTGGELLNGSDTIQVQLINGGLSNVATITLANYVENNTAPVWSTVPEQLIIAGASINIPAGSYASDIDDDTLTFAKASGNASLSVNSSTGAVTGSLTDAAGTFPVTLSATDGLSDPVETSFNIITSLAVPAFNFTDVTDHELSDSVSAVSEVTNVPAGARLEFSGGEISVNNGSSYTSESPQYAVDGQTKARITLTTSASNSTPVSGEMTINGVTREFTATTEAAASITLIAVRNTQLETVALTALPSYNATSITFQADTGSGFSTINTDSGAPFAYSYDASGVSLGDSISFRAIDGDTISNEAVIRFRASTGRRGMSRSITKTMTR